MLDKIKKYEFYYKLIIKIYFYLGKKINFNLNFTKFQNFKIKDNLDYSI
jgi:hypothetical protein